MRISILTWYFAYNYGAKAHSYALMRVIEGLGHSCEMIQYIPNKSLRVQIRSNINYANRYKHPLLLLRVIIRCLKFNHTKMIYKQSHRVIDASGIDALGYDRIVLGSDEILNILHPIHDPIYFGVGIKSAKFLYAPSSGQTSVNTKLPEKCVDSLNECIGLSARDKHTKELIENNTGKEVPLVLDPTLLYDFQDIGVSSWKYKNYILVYSFDPLTDYCERIIEYARMHALKIFCLGRFSKIADKSFDTASFKLWIEMFRHAAIVITDSFHGTVFAIKNQKPFVICARPDKVNKIMDLVSDLGIENSFYDVHVSIDEYLEKGIDYSLVSKKLEEKKTQSLEYLKSCLVSRDE